MSYRQSLLDRVRSNNTNLAEEIAMEKDTVKIYARRDSATAALRKIGVPSSQYRNYISVASDGQFACDVEAAKSFVQKLTGKKPIKTTKRLQKERSQTVEGAVKSSKKEKEKKTTISGLCRTLILAGKSNKEVFAAMRKEFGEEKIGPEKSTYPCWYRCELRRRGELS